MIKDKKSLELERLKFDGQDATLPRLRSQRFVQNPFVVCSSVTAWNSFMDGVVQRGKVLGQQGGSDRCERFGDAKTVAEENDIIDNNCDSFNDYDEMMFML